jgi:hypothetical protein
VDLVQVTVMVLQAQQIQEQQTKVLQVVKVQVLMELVAVVVQDKLAAQHQEIMVVRVVTV